VRWTGDADIDVMVKEPGGTVCSLRNQRTTSGGVLISDSSSDDKPSVDGHVAVYVCPKAFSGNYQLLIRRVFGKLTTGSATVELVTHYNSDKAKALVKKIPLDGNEALVKFDVADGRRKESIQEQQLANAAVAAVAQVNLTRHPEILAQQLDAVNNPAAAAALGAVQQAAATAGQAQQQANPSAFPAAWPNGFQGAVGYTPIIITLPEGTNLAMMGVVSADRRYVRITCVPMFSAVSEVHTFSLASGQTTSTPGVGTGGQGYSGIAGQGAGGVGNGNNNNGGGANNGIGAG